MKEVQTLADNKIAMVLSRDSGVNQVVRRKKRKNVYVSTALSVILAIAILSGFAEAQGAQKTNPNDEFRV